MKNLQNIKDSQVKGILKTLLERVEKLEQPGIIHFAKVKPDAKIPTKRAEDAGYDLYACFDEDAIIIQPHETVMIPTGIATAFSHEYVFKLAERGSTGTKGIAQRCGVIDSGFRGEILVPVTNTGVKPIIITKCDEHTFPKVVNVLLDKTSTNMPWNILKKCLGDAIVYPYEKAISQGILFHLKESVSGEIPYEVLKEIPSERGSGMLGSSKK